MHGRDSKGWSAVPREDQDDVVRELLETYGWGTVLERAKEHCAELRAAVFNDSQPDAVRLGKARELAGIRALFDRLYREVGAEMPADFRKAFE